MEKPLEYTELKLALTTRVGLTEEQAKKSIALITGELKARLPDPVAAQVDGILAGEAFDYKELLDYKWEGFRAQADHKLNEWKGKAADWLDKII